MDFGALRSIGRRGSERTFAAIKTDDRSGPKLAANLRRVSICFYDFLDGTGQSARGPISVVH